MKVANDDYTPHFPEYPETQMPVDKSGKAEIPSPE